MPQTNVPSSLRLLLLLPALLVTACATTSPTTTSCPALPSLPSARTPQPSKPYLESARDQLKSWQDRLRATPLTP